MWVALAIVFAATAAAVFFGICFSLLAWQCCHRPRMTRRSLQPLPYPQIATDTPRSCNDDRGVAKFVLRVAMRLENMRETGLPQLAKGVTWMELPRFAAAAGFVDSLMFVVFIRDEDVWERVYQGQWDSFHHFPRPPPLVIAGGGEGAWAALAYAVSFIRNFPDALPHVRLFLWGFEPQACPPELEAEFLSVKLQPRTFILENSLDYYSVLSQIDPDAPELVTRRNLARLEQT